LIFPILVYYVCMAVSARWLGICLATLGFFSFPQKIFASSVVINEIHPSEEWVELYNPDGEDLTGCTLFLHKDRSDSQKVDLTDGYGVGEFTIVTWSGSWLKNTGGDTVELVCTGFEDQAAYGDNGSLPLPGSGESLARIPDGGNWSTLAQPTKGASNGDELANSPSPSSEENSPSGVSNIFINEVMACPDTGEDEWVEFFNENDTPVDLNGLYLEDAKGSTRTITDFSIGAKTYGFYKFSSGFLNNDGDSVRLFAQDELKDAMNYSDCEKGYSWSKVNGQWCQAEPTAGSGNSSCVEINSETDGETSPSPSLSPKASPQATVVSSPSPKPQKSPVSSGKKTPEATFTGEILGATQSGEEKSEEKPDEMRQEKSKDWLVPLGLSGGGLVLLSTAAFPFVKPKVSKLLSRFPKKTQSLEQ
jgi:hypothetical protein